MLMRPIANIQATLPPNKYLFEWSMNMRTRASHLAADNAASGKASGASRGEGESGAPAARERAINQPPPSLGPAAAARCRCVAAQQSVQARVLDRAGGQLL